jgi:hypothetical protein
LYFAVGIAAGDAACVGILVNDHGRDAGEDGWGGVAIAAAARATGQQGGN